MRSRMAMYAVACLAAAGCSASEPTTAGLEKAAAVASVQGEDVDAALVAMADEMNASLEAEGASYRYVQAEWFGEENAGNEVFFNDRGNKKLTADFVPGDPRRGGGTNIKTFINPVGSPNGLTAAQVVGAISRAMSTWDAVNCSVIPIAQSTTPFAPFGGDIQHQGFFTLPTGVLGVTLTAVFIAGPMGPPTDIDNNNKADVALRLIRYSRTTSWAINNHFDLETVALHEAGHGLSQGHFGKLFQTESNEKFHFSPRAVMNAAYTGIQQTIEQTDNAGHCANWASWPNN